MFYALASQVLQLPPPVKFYPRLKAQLKCQLRGTTPSLYLLLPLLALPSPSCYILQPAIITSICLLVRCPLCLPESKLQEGKDLIHPVHGCVSRPQGTVGTWELFENTETHPDEKSHHTPGPTYLLCFFISTALTASPYTAEFTHY